MGGGGADHREESLQRRRHELEEGGWEADEEHSVITASGARVRERERRAHCSAALGLAAAVAARLGLAWLRLHLQVERLEESITADRDPSEQAR